METKNNNSVIKQIVDKGYFSVENISLSDHFAGLAMTSLLINGRIKRMSIKDRIKVFFGRPGGKLNVEYSWANNAHAAYEAADAMLTAREK